MLLVCRIDDPDAVKPSTWDDRRNVPDEEATPPEGWLEEEPTHIPDPAAKQPKDWDEVEDGAWEVPLIRNPKCTVGCGVWERPKMRNPAYKGPWIPPRIPNPDYKVGGKDGGGGERLVSGRHKHEERGEGARRGSGRQRYGRSKLMLKQWEGRREEIEDMCRWTAYMGLWLENLTAVGEQLCMYEGIKCSHWCCPRPILTIRLDKLPHPPWDLYFYLDLALY